MHRTTDESNRVAHNGYSCLEREERYRELEKSSILPDETLQRLEAATGCDLSDIGFQAIMERVAEACEKLAADTRRQQKIAANYEENNARAKAELREAEDRIDELERSAYRQEIR